MNPPNPRPLNLWPALRILIGLVFVVSGGEKLLSPYQNFVYILQAYKIVPGILEVPVALVMPWLEMVCGVFLIVGLWLPLALRGALLLFLGFIVMVGQALIRRLPLEECGCFGSLIHIPPQVIIVLDSCLFALVLAMILKMSRASAFSLDRFFK